MAKMWNDLADGDPRTAILTAWIVKEDPAGAAADRRPAGSGTTSRTACTGSTTGAPSPGSPSASASPAPSRRFPLKFGKPP